MLKFEDAAADGRRELGDQKIRLRGEKGVFVDIGVFGVGGKSRVVKALEEADAEVSDEKRADSEKPEKGRMAGIVLDDFFRFVCG